MFLETKKGNKLLTIFISIILNPDCVSSAAFYFSSFWTSWAVTEWEAN